MAVFWSLLLSVAMVIVQETECESSCQVKYAKKGCYKDEPSPNRKLPDLLLNERTTGILGPKWTNWDSSIHQFICDCAKAASSKGYKYFGIQYYTECWAGNVTAPIIQQTFEELPKRCIDTKDFTQCDVDSLECVGKGWANYVYEVVPTTKPPAIDCKDKNEKDCQEFADHGLCSDKYPDVLKHCPWSCKQCFTT